MNKFLFELGTEEIPAKMIEPALNQLEDGFRALLSESSLQVGAVHLYSSPRRLSLLAEDLPDTQPDQRSTIIGPPESVARDSDGDLTRAGEGFARQHGIPADQLETIETEKGRYLGFRQVTSGSPLSTVLASGLGGVIAQITWSRNMYWRESRFRFVRPIRWLVALWNEEIVDFEFEEIRSSRRSRGHRFLGAQEVEIPSPGHYVKLLRENFVLVDAGQRRRQIVKELAGLTPGGCTVVDDPELLTLTCFLNEHPTVVLGRFESSFLKLPREILVTVMRHHQKYFAMTGESEELQPFFMTVTNTAGDPEGRIRTGHERVLRARLEDAVFFWESDRRTKLEERVTSLARVTFQQDLGSYLDKTRRLQEICRRLSPDNQTLDQAALLCKTDLTTETVFEISELQGVMGGLYAREEGYAEDIWKAIYEHYQPISLDDSSPTTRNGALLSIADRLDTIAGCFGVGVRPRGSSDPFGLRRQAQGLIKILLDHGLDWETDDLLHFACVGLEADSVQLRSEIKVFLERRLRRILERQGIQYDVLNAVMASGIGSAVSARRRARALQEIREEPEFRALTVAFKRIRNILGTREVKDEGVDQSLLVENAEQNLFRSFSDLQSRLPAPLASGEYRDVLALMATLSGPVDRFFDEVMVLAEDQQLRRNRLGLLHQISEMFLQVADISQIVKKG